MDYTNYKQVYLAGDMLHKSMFDYRKQQKEEIEGIEGLQVYNPSSNDDINSKKTAKKEKLAERIVEQDTQAIEKADVYVIDLPTADAGGRGTVAEIGQIYQMKREAKNLISQLEEMQELSMNTDGTYNDEYYTLQGIIDEKQKVVDKICLVYSDDVRWNTSDMNDTMDRIPYSFNAYTYGLVMYITNGEGVISWEEVLKRLEKLGEQDG
ncbi:nucleoside 2-deoxyribosyltransferase [Staphylococcus phage PG-2021_35]